MSPAQLVVGAPGATVKVSGRQFVSSARVRWNAQDRVTAYLNDSTLSVDLTLEDLAALGNGDITVVNPAPDGGTSNPLSVVVGYAIPVITGITPSSLLATGHFASVTITGTGFIPGSSARVNASTELRGTYRSPTEIELVFSPPDLNSGGLQQITVVNPSPGGGTSNTFDLLISNPIPQIVALRPDTVVTGAGFTLTLFGMGFVSSSVIRWNGIDRPITSYNPSRITVAIPAEDAAAAMIGTVTVVNAGPGGGTSNTAFVRVRDPAPAISSLNPATITAGSANTTVAIGGSNFSGSSRAHWNGQQRVTTFISATTINVELLASDLTTGPTGIVSVLNPGSSGGSNSVVLIIVPTSLTATVTNIVALKNNRITYDSLRNVVYASVPSSGGTYANSIVRLDPNTGAITGSIAVHTNPSDMSISDDWRNLYVGHDSSTYVVRIDLSTFAKDLEFSLNSDGYSPWNYTSDLVVIPGSPRSVAVASVERGPNLLFNFLLGVAIYDDGVMRTKTTPPGIGTNRLVRGPDATRIYGFANQANNHGFRSLVILPDGMIQESVTLGLVTGLGADIEYDRGFVFSTRGAVVNVNSMTRAGTIEAEGAVRPDVAHGRVHFLNNSTIRTFHYASFTGIGTFTNPALANLSRLERWGSDGLVAGGGNTIVFMRGSLIAQ